MTRRAANPRANVVDATYPRVPDEFRHRDKPQEPVRENIRADTPGSNEFGAIACIYQDSPYKDALVDFTLKLTLDENGVGSTGTPFHVISVLTQKGAIDHKNQFHDTLTIFFTPQRPLASWRCP